MRIVSTFRTHLPRPGRQQVSSEAGPACAGEPLADDGLRAPEGPDPAVGPASQPEAFEVFFEETSEFVFRVVLAAGRDRDLANEATQEAYTRAWKEWETVGRHPNPRAWVIRTAKNYQVSAWRKRRRQILVDRAPDRVVPDHDPAVADALRRLPEPQRWAVALRFLGDMDVASIAETLGRSEATVHRLLRKARAALKVVLEPGESGER